MITIQLDEETSRGLDELCLKLNMTPEDVIKMLIKEALQKLDLKI